MIKKLSVLVVILFIMGSLAIAAEVSAQSENAREKRMQNMSKAAEKNWFGRFDFEDNQVVGKFVKFGYDNTTGTIENFQIYDGSSLVQVFDRITVENFEHTKTQIDNAVFMMNGTHSRITVHNNPRTIVQITNPYDDTPFEVEYTVDEEVDITETSSSRPYSIVYRLSSNEVEGVINTPLKTTLEDKVITVDGEGRSETAHSMFMNRPAYIGEAISNQEQIRDAVAERNLSGEIDIVGRGEGNISHQMTYRENFQMRVMEMERERLRIRVQSEDPEGTCIMIRTEKQSLDLEIDEIKFEIDGDEAEKTSFEEVLKGGDKMKYSVREREDGLLEFAVNVPSFSARQITIEKQSSSIPGYTATVLFVALLLTTVVWVIRKRE